MKKRLGSVLLAGALSLSMLPMSALAAGADNFQKRNTYTPGQFTDVTANDWFAGSVQGACELGLMKGSSENTFAPGQSLTWAQALALASRLHSIYYTGADSFKQGEPWYQVYVDYALNNGLISGTDLDFNGVINRGDFACIMARALPAEALPPVNAVDDHAIPDVPFDSYIAGPVYTLYRAGILTGSDTAGSFGPSTGITRDAVAAIVTRMADAAQRKAITLTAVPVTLYAKGGRTAQVFPDQVAASLAAGWYLTAPVAVTLYAKDGRTAQVYPDEMDAYLATGWYRELPASVTLYAPDGRSCVVFADEVPGYLSTGWYMNPVTTVYADDGRSMVVGVNDVESYEAVGWHRNKEDIYTVMYSLEGNETQVLKSEVPSYQQVGWYLYPDYLCAQADSYIGAYGYDTAVVFLEDCLDNTTVDDPLYVTLSSKRAQLLNDWRWAIGCPVAILGYYMTENSIGIPEVNVTFRNLAQVELTALEVTWTCIDAYGNVTTDWPTLYNGTFTGYDDTANLAPGDVMTDTWTMNSNERTTSVSNLHMDRCAFADGSQWN